VALRSLRGAAVFAFPILLIVAVLVVLLPLLFGERTFASLSKLDLSPSVALACAATEPC
jgi:hypothetical protein